MTPPSEIDFRQYSETIARNFLQTVVVVDDRAYYGLEESSRPTEPIKSPARPRFTESEEIPEAQEEGSQEEESAAANHEVEDDLSREITQPLIDQARTPKETSEDRAHILNAKYLTESFAERGMVCSVLRPEGFEVEHLDKKVYRLAERADIVMLDWVLHQDVDGAKVTELIVGMTKTAAERNRVRLIVVYTGELGLFGIIDRVEGALRSNGVTNVSRVDDFTLVSGPTRIAVYAKNNLGGVGLSDELRARLVPADSLPDKLISEFTEMTAGLVSNVALDSLAAIRSNTHRILSTFNPDIDAPFLAHRAMSPQPEDAKDLLAHLVGTELLAVLEGHEVGKAADEKGGVDVIKAWIEMHETHGYGFATRFSMKESNSAEALMQLHTLLRKGIADSALKGQFASFKNDPHKKGLTGKLSSTSKPADELENEFAVLTTLKSDYRSESNPPALFPGALLKEVAKGADAAPTHRYWVCIQPICDCVRIKETKLFPFLELEVITENNKKFDLVLPDKDSGAGFVRVLVMYRPYRSRLENFAPSKDGSQTVRGEIQGGEIYLTATNGTRYRWLGELKFEHAQRVVNKYAAELSRVGLNESEWLRRWGPS
jgi:hypothetical protein